MSAENLLRKLRDALEVADIPYMVTGSFVSAVHGVPRATHDIDVVIAPTTQQLMTLMKQFPEWEYYAELEDALQALHHVTQFHIIDERGVWKVDFIIRKNRPFSTAEFERRRVTKILGIPVYAVTAEDLLIAKLEWAKLGESERQLRDASGIIAIQLDNLDIPYVERWVAALALETEWERAKEMATT
ncbi:MAG: hypothetical protein ACJ74H_07530 [Thermoanaerobaculia bacterium]